MSFCHGRWERHGWYKPHVVPNDQPLFWDLILYLEMSEQAGRTQRFGKYCRRVLKWILYTWNRRFSQLLTLRISRIYLCFHAPVHPPQFSTHFLPPSFCKTFRFFHLSSAWYESLRSSGNYNRSPTNGKSPSPPDSAPGWPPKPSKQ